LEPDLRLSSIGQNPCGPLAGNRDRDRRPCEEFPNASAARPVANAQTASRDYRGAEVRIAAIRNTLPPARFCLRRKRKPEDASVRY
jgi:hypothetical protein